MPIRFLTVDSLGLEQTIVKVGAMAARATAAQRAAELAGAHRAGAAAVDILKGLTPVDTGNLRDNTTYDVVPEGYDTRIELLQYAVSDQGFPYAHARAYGHALRNGSFWTPPEQPPYPQQAQEQAMPMILSIQAEIGWSAMRATVIGSTL